MCLLQHRRLSLHFIFLKFKLTVSRSWESSVFTSVFTFSMYSCETSQREDRRVGLMTIASSVVAEWVASGTLDPGASPRISLSVSAGSQYFRRRSLIFLSFSLSLKRWLRALPMTLSWACTSLDMVSLDLHIAITTQCLVIAPSPHNVSVFLN